MKKVILKLFLVSIIAYNFISCEKEKIEYSNNKNQSENVKLDEENNNLNKNATSFENPYEFVGEIHNAVLDVVLTNVNFDNMTVDEKAAIISVEITNEFNGRNMQVNGNNHIVNDEMRQIVNSMPNDDALWDEMMQQSDKIGKGIIQKLKNELKNYNVHNDFGLTIANLKQIEKNVNNNSGISNEDRTFYLSLLAIGRNTFSFWRLKYINAGESFDNDRTPYASDIKGFFHGWRRARSQGGSLEDAFDMGMFYADTYSARP